MVASLEKFALSLALVFGAVVVVPAKVLVIAAADSRCFGYGKDCSSASNVPVGREVTSRRTL